MEIVNERMNQNKKKKLGEIINWGLTDKGKNKWEWIKIGKKKIGCMNLTWIAMEIENQTWQ